MCENPESLTAPLLTAIVDGATKNGAAEEGARDSKSLIKNFEKF